VVGNEIFNVGSDQQNYMIQQIGELVHQQVFTAELILEDSLTDNRNYRVSFRKIRDRLGFEPQWTVEQGILQVAEAIADGQVEDYQDPKYHNVRHLSEAGMIEVIRADDDWVREHLETRTAPQLTS
jgi:hypothetical protein